MKLKLIFILILLASFESKSQPQDTLLNKLSDYIDLFKSETTKENSKLWGISFDMPVIIATSDYKNYIITNKQIEGFKAYKSIFYGKTDEIKPGGQGRKTWRDKEWAFFTYPFESFNNNKDLLNLYYHEAFHRNQIFLNLKGNWTQCKHLNASEARTLLKLEYYALFKAFNEKDYKPYLIDALTFRAYRYYLYPNAYNEEQEIEILEGLANYTGLKLSGFSNKEISKKLQNSMTFNPQTFAYITGAFYSFILDKSGKDWRNKIKKHDNFLYFTQKIIGFKLPENLTLHIKNVRNKYNWKEISKEEKTISKEISNQEKIYNKTFLKNPVVKISTKECKGYLFQSSIIYPFKNGKIYNGVTTQGDWGKLVAKDEIFIADEIYLPTPFKITYKQIKGKGWIIYLNDNWTISQTSKNYFELIQNKKK